MFSGLLHPIYQTVPYMVMGSFESYTVLTKTHTHTYTHTHTHTHTHTYTHTTQAAIYTRHSTRHIKLHTCTSIHTYYITLPLNCIIKYVCTYVYCTCKHESFRHSIYLVRYTMTLEQTCKQQHTCAVRM